MDQTACSGCGAVMSTREVLYTTEAKVVCAGCYAAEDILATDKRAAANIQKAAYGCLLAAVLSIFTPLLGLLAFAVSVGLSIMSGIFALRSLLPGNERFTMHLTKGERLAVNVCAVGGLVIAGILGVMMLGTLNEVLA